MNSNMKHDADRQREWARWCEKARAANVEEQRRGGKEIKWTELPLVPPAGSAHE